jgi:hypothetical protein
MSATTINFLTLLVLILIVQTGARQFQRRLEGEAEVIEEDEETV